MAMSGIEICADVIPTYRDKLKLKKELGCLVLRLSDNLKEVIIDRQVGLDEWRDLESLKKNLPENDARYVLYDFKYTTAKSGQSNSKIVFISWIPDCAPIKTRMMYASTKETLKTKLEGLGAVIEATDYDEVCEEDILSKVNR